MKLTSYLFDIFYFFTFCLQLAGNINEQLFKNCWHEAWRFQDFIFNGGNSDACQFSIVPQPWSDGDDTCTEE